MNTHKKIVISSLSTRSRFIRAAASFLLGFCIILATISYLSQRKFNGITDSSISSFPEKLILWELRRDLKPTEIVRLHARHRFSGERGEFRFVYYYGLNDTPPPLNQLHFSEPFQVQKAGEWSEFHLKAQTKRMMIGLIWKGDIPPVVIYHRPWENPLHLNSVAAHPIKLGESYIPETTRSGPWSADFYEGERTNTPYSSLILVALLLIATLFYSRTASFLVFTYALVGIIFAFQVEAIRAPAYWNWSFSYYSLIPLPWQYAALGGTVIGAFLPLFLPKISRFLITPVTPVGAVSLSALVAGLGWMFRANLVLGDGHYGFLNESHAPLLKVLSHRLAGYFGQEVGSLGIGYALPSLIGGPLFVLLIYYLLRNLHSSGNPTFLALGLFLTLLSSQCFFGTIEVYGLVQILVVSTFLLVILADKSKISSFWSAFAALGAGLMHVSEYLLFVPVGILWGKRCFFDKKTTVVRTVIAGVCFIITAWVSLHLLAFSIFRDLYQADFVTFTRAYPLIGISLVQQYFLNSGEMLSLFEYQNRGNGDPILSIPNFFLRLNFCLKYSIFACLLPFLYGGRVFLTLKEDNRSIYFLTFYLVYFVFFAAANVGWTPAVRDWDLFVPLAVAGMALLIQQKRPREYPIEYSVIFLVQLSQILPWILSLHYAPEWVNPFAM